MRLKRFQASGSSSKKIRDLVLSGQLLEMVRPKAAVFSRKNTFF
jgi:hypothetical protein